MDDLASVLRQIQAGLADPGKREIAQVAQELLAKQVRQSWQQRQTEDEFPWPPLKRPSFAGVLGKHMGMAHFYLLHYKESGEKRFYGDTENESSEFFGKAAPMPTEAFIMHKAIRAIRDGTVNDQGFETHDLAKYGLWQSDGTDKTGWGPPIPARSFWAFGGDILDLVAELLAKKAAKTFSEAA